MDLTPQNLQVLFQGYKAHFQQGMASLGDDSKLYERMCTHVPSTARQESYPWLNQLPRLREWLGDRVVYGLEAGDFVIKNRKFELTVGVIRDTVEDDTYGLYSPMMTEMGRSAADHPNEMLVEALEGNPICYDGQPLFDDEHVVLDKDGKETLVSNDMGGSGVPWYVCDLSRAIRPLVFQKRRAYDFRAMNDLNSPEVFKTDQFMFGIDARLNVGAGLWQLIVVSRQTLNHANYAAARARLTTLKGDYERPLGIRHTHTVVPTSLESAARIVLNNGLKSGGETNEWANTSVLEMNGYLQQAA